jgi:hypothetical protein
MILKDNDLHDIVLTTVIETFCTYMNHFTNGENFSDLQIQNYELTVRQIFAQQKQLTQC